MKLFKKLCGDLIEQLNIDHNKITTVADHCKITPLFDSIAFNSLEVARLTYDGVINIECYSGDAQELILFIVLWLDTYDNDEHRQNFDLNDPTISAIVNDNITEDIEITLPFVEKIIITEMAQGTIKYQDKSWAIYHPEINIATELLSIKGANNE